MKENNILTVVFNILANTGYWILAIHYWTLSFRLYLMCAKKEIGDKVHTTLMVIYLVGLIYNILVPILALIYYTKDI